MVPERSLSETAAEEPKPRARVRAGLQMKTFYVRWSLTILVAILALSRFAAAAQVGYAIDRTQAQLQVAQAQAISLEGQVSALSSAGRLTAIASALKLAPAPPVMSVTVPQGGAARGAGHGPTSARRVGVLADVGALIQSITRAVSGM